MSRVYLFVIIFVAVLGIVGFLSKIDSKVQMVDNFQDRNLSKLKKLKLNKPSKPKGEMCLTNKNYAAATNPLKNLLSIPFNVNDYSTKYWGMVPFCAKLRNGSNHSGLDFELKPDSKIYSSTDGIVSHTQIGKEEGSGEIIAISGDGFSLDYSGLKNLRVKKGDKVKKGDYIADVVRIPHGEHHLHLGFSINGKQECPLKYMDEEFYNATKEMFAVADYGSQTSAKCLCECESLTVPY